MLRGKVKRNFANETTTLIGGIVNGHSIFECDFSWVIGQEPCHFHGC